MSGSFDFPDNTPITDKDGKVTLPWSQVYTRWHRIITASQQSGPTSERPTSLLWVGRIFFDTSLGANGKPIWVAQVKPSIVWVDATSTPV